MFEVRIHGRGGQGAVTAAEMLAVAAFAEDWHAQAFPTFGSERTGAPVVSFCRIDNQAIRIHDPIEKPDALVVLDITLVHQVRIFDGIGPETYLLLNTTRSMGELGLDQVMGILRPERVRSVPATEIGRRILGKPLPNTALLGAFAALTDLVSIDSISTAIRSVFSSALAERNVLAAEAGFHHIREEKEGPSHA